MQMTIICTLAAKTLDSRTKLWECSNKTVQRYNVQRNWNIKKTSTGQKLLQSRA